MDDIFVVIHYICGRTFWKEILLVKMLSFKIFLPLEGKENLDNSESFGINTKVIKLPAMILKSHCGVVRLNYQ